MLDDLLNGRSRVAESDWQFPRDVILNVAIEHRLMHAETLTYMLHQLSPERKMVPHDYVSGEFASDRVASHFLDDRDPGRDRDAGYSSRWARSFGWDNEFEESFRASAGVRDWLA